jgi:RNA polymerase sigma-70 factor (ECF subfamily)
VLERDLLARADPNRGRFRSFLRTVCGRFLGDCHDRQNALKRGGGRTSLPIDARDAEGRYAREPVHALTPARIFDRTWALTLLDRVLEQLCSEYLEAGRPEVFEQLRFALTRDPRAVPCATIAGRLGISEGAVRGALHRLRRRFGRLLRQEIAATVDDPAEVDDEIRDLFVALES